MSDVTYNSSGTDSEVFYEVDHEGTGTDENKETVNGTNENVAENNFDVSNNENESVENTEEIETVEGESVHGYEELLFETVDRSDDSLSSTTDYSNYFSFLIAVVLGLGAVICWAKGFTE